MNFVCLIYAYKDPEQLKRTIDALGDMDIYIHLDAKSDISNFKKLIHNNNVKWIENRVFVCWGGYTQVEVLKEFMRCVIKSGKQYDRVLSLTAMDYPVFSLRKLSAYFGEDSSKNYCTSLNVTQNGSPKKIVELQKYWFFDIKIKNYQLMRVVRKLIYFLMTFLYKTHILRKKTYFMVDNKTWDVYFSTDYWCLTFDAFLYVYQQITEKKEIEKYFKHSLAPSELITATILSNSKYFNTIEHITLEQYKGLGDVTPLHYMQYDETFGTGMKILDENDYEDIIKSGKPFCRKVLSNRSIALEYKLDLHRNGDI